MMFRLHYIYMLQLKILLLVFNILRNMHLATCRGVVEVVNVKQFSSSAANGQFTWWWKNNNDVKSFLVKMLQKFEEKYFG